jgi:hypothetical protein
VEYDEKERIAMSEEEQVVEEQETEQAAEAGQRTVTQEIKLQAKDLSEAFKELFREGMIRRVTVLRNDRILLDIPLAVGVGASVLLAMYMPHITALAAAGALIGGCTLRVEREEPPEEA